MVVSLDPRETYCGCGGRGHLEGIMGHRAMRLRFLDLEPDEIFANASEKTAGLRDSRCVEVDVIERTLKGIRHGRGSTGNLNDELQNDLLAGHVVAANLYRCVGVVSCPPSGGKNVFVESCH